MPWYQNPKKTVRERGKEEWGEGGGGVEEEEKWFKDNYQLSLTNLHVKSQENISQQNPAKYKMDHAP